MGDVFGELRDVVGMMWCCLFSVIIWLVRVGSVCSVCWLICL